MSRRIAVIYLTPSGGAIAGRLAQSWSGAGSEGVLDVVAAVTPLSDQVRSLWRSYDSFILIMAVGIVVRLVAPLLESKWRDPGVVVVDEGGNFTVSLVGGHWGEANRLAREVAACLGAVPVVTTATDVQGRPAVDLLAKQWGFLPAPRERVKAVNSALLAGEQVTIYSEWDLSGDLPLAEDGVASGLELVLHSNLHELEGSGSMNHQDLVTVAVTSRTVALPPRGLCLRPPSLAAGIGCRRGVEAAEIIAALDEALRIAGRSRDSLTLLASHEVKADEAGLLEAARQSGLTLKFFDSGSLAKVYETHDGLQHSEFVQQQLGVGGVCETAALAAVPDGTLVLAKTKFNRITVALAEAGWLWSASGRAIRRI